MVAVPAVPHGDLDKSLFDKTFRTEQPVLISGLSRQWKAHDRWEPSELKLLLGGLEVQPFVAFDDLHFLENKDTVRRCKMRFTQVIEHVFEGRPLQNDGAVAVTAAGSADPRLARSCLHSDGTRITTNSNTFVAVTPVPPPIVASSRIYLRGALFDSLREDIEVPTFMDGGTAKLSNDLSGIW
jgi:hypothetical protein